MVATNGAGKALERKHRGNPHTKTHTEGLIRSTVPRPLGHQAMPGGLVQESLRELRSNRPLFIPRRGTGLSWKLKVCLAPTPANPQPPQALCCPKARIRIHLRPVKNIRSQAAQWPGPCEPQSLVGREGFGAIAMLHSSLIWKNMVSRDKLPVSMPKLLTG